MPIPPGTPDPNGAVLNPGPASRAVVVSPSDTMNLPYVARGIYVGTSGNIAILTFGGDSIVFQNVQSGSIIPVSTIRVLATNTTASNIVALW